MQEFWQFIVQCVTKIINWMPALLDGTKITVLLTLTSVSTGLVLSLFLALGKISKSKIINKLCGAYIFFFRGTPLLMQLFLIYYGLPQIHPALTINDRFLAAYLAYALNSAAYLAEIIRAAILSIDKGQLEASKSLGMSYTQAMRHIIIPQSIRRLIPPVGNEFIMIVKDTALVSTIALMDLSKKTSQIMTSSGDALVFVPALAIYLIITAIFTLILNKLEKRFSIYE
jgi:polar amino acid transport system permease protein